MEPSKHYQEILRLGKKIAKLFDDPEDGDITIKWMSNYLSELFTKLEKEGDGAEKERLKKEICDTVIQLWQNRKHFPPGHVPLERMSNLLEILGSFDDSQRNRHDWQLWRSYENMGSWGKYLKALRNSIEQSLQLAVSSVASQQLLRKELEWKDHLDLLDEDERNLVNWVDSAIEGGASNEIVRIITQYEGLEEGDDEKARIEKVFKKLRELHAEQGKRLDSFEKTYMARFILAPPKN